MRQHVNPLSSFFQLENELPGLGDLFDDIDLPIHLDIGCAGGKFLLEMASANSEYNYLGIDIRESLVNLAEQKRNSLGLNNLKFLFCNANISLENWFFRLENNKVKKVTLQFPDPWFKQRHKKRRVLTTDFLLILAKNLDPGSELFIQTDVQSLMKEMMIIIENTSLFNCQNVNIETHLIKNPFQFPTEREKYVAKKGLPIYRKIYRRNSEFI